MKKKKRKKKYLNSSKKVFDPKISNKLWYPNKKELISYNLNIDTWLKSLIYPNVDANSNKIINNHFKLDGEKEVIRTDRIELKPTKVENVYTKCKWSPYLGKRFPGYVSYTIKRGKILKEKGNIISS